MTSIVKEALAAMQRYRTPDEYLPGTWLFGRHVPDLSIYFHHLNCNVPVDVVAKIPPARLGALARVSRQGGERKLRKV